MGFRVANIISRFNSASGGPPRTVSAIANASVGHWRAELFSTEYVEPHNDTLLTGGFNGHVNLLATTAQTALGGTARALRIFRSHEPQLLRAVAPDVVHIHGLWSPLLLAYVNAAYRNRIPYIVAPHGTLEPWALSVHAVRKAIALRSYQGRILLRAAAIHTTSEREAEHVRQLRWIRCPVFVVPNIIDEPVAIPPVPTPDSGRRILLYLSRVHEQKGLDMLLQAWNVLRPIDWELSIVGGGAQVYVDRLKHYCAQHRLANVTFRGHVDGTERELTYRSASAFVLPSYSENFGNVVAEAMVRGLPVITTTGTPWSDIKTHQLGWYVEPAFEALTSALRELFATSPATLVQIGQRAREYTLSRFSTDTVRADLLHMYQSVIESMSSAAATGLTAGARAVGA